MNSAEQNLADVVEDACSTEVNAEDDSLKETWHEALRGQALAIVRSDSNRQCVQAGPGTGKSFCMTRRILRLIQQRKVKPEEVLAVTFTRTAATDLRSSLTNTLGEKHSAFRACTLHSLCFNIVEGERFLEVRKRHPRFLLSVTKSGCMNFECAPMLADLATENPGYGSARPQTKRIKAFEANWARRQEDPLGIAGDSIEAAYGTSLLNWLRFHRAMLVGELVKEAYEFMSAEPDSKWRRKYRAILVDEYQDLNKLDQAVVDLLSEADGSVCSVVGDLDQSIYSFRCAHPDGLQEYGARDGVEALTMEVSWRCPKTHLAAAQNGIQKNTKKASKYPSAVESAKDGEISVRRWNDQEAEVQGVVAFVSHCYAQGVPLGEILVMAPSRLIGMEIRKALVAEGIDAKSYFAEEQLEVEDAQKAFTLLTLLANKLDRVSLRCWLGGWTSGRRAGNYRVLRRYCEANNAEPWEVMDEVVNGTVTLAGTSALVDSFKEVRQMIDNLNDCVGRELLDKVFPPTQEWAYDIRVLAEEVVKDNTTAKELHSYLADSISQPVIPVDVSFVRVMSLHKAKGLTVRASAIAGAIEGLIPRMYDPDKSVLTEFEHEEEQRRLLYVAMTRSTERLLISSPKYVSPRFARQYQIPVVREGSAIKTIPSSFLQGLGLPAVTNTTAFP